MMYKHHNHSQTNRQMGEYKKIKFGLKIGASNNTESYEAKQMLAIQAFTEPHFKMAEESACKRSLLLENKSSERYPRKITIGNANLCV